MAEIENAQILSELFGHWPDFHDAEVISLRLETSDGEGAALEAYIEVAEMSDESDSAGDYRDLQRARVTLRFGGVSNASVLDFGRQNVLDALEIAELATSDGNGEGTESQYSVRFVPIPGFGEVQFACSTIAVVSATVVQRAI